MSTRGVDDDSWVAGRWRRLGRPPDLSRPGGLLIYFQITGSTPAIILRSVHRYLLLTPHGWTAWDYELLRLQNEDLIWEVRLYSVLNRKYSSLSPVKDRFVHTSSTGAILAVSQTLSMGLFAFDESTAFCSLSSSSGALSSLSHAGMGDFYL